MNRRRFVANAGSVVGGLSLGGCVADDGISGGDGVSGDDGSSGNEQNQPDSDIRLTDTDVGSSGGVIRGTFEFTNDGDQDGEADFATALRIGSDGVYGTHRNETTVSVPAEETASKELVLVENDRLSGVAREELDGGYLEVALALDGERVESLSFGEQPSRHVSFRVVYGGQWQGAVGGGGGVRNVQGSGNTHMAIDNDARIVSGNAQKQDQSTQRLLVQIIVDGAVIAEQATTAGYGVAQVATEASDSPISNPTEPYTPPEITVTTRRSVEDTDDGADVDPADVPGEQAAKATVERYYDALTQADAEAVNALIHPDSPGEPVTEEEIADLERFDYEIEGMTVTSLDAQRGTATVRGAITLIEDGTAQDPIEFAFELRVYDGEWKLWEGVE